MRTAILVLTVLAATARAEPAPEPEPPAIKAATAWMAAALDPKAGLGAPSKARPLHYLLDSPLKACRGLAHGYATTAATARQIKRCLIDTWRTVAEPPRAADSFHVWEPARAFESFDDKSQKEVQSVARDATIVLAQYGGNGVKMDAWLVVGKDGAVRAIWMDRSVFE